MSAWTGTLDLIRGVLEASSAWSAACSAAPADHIVVGVGGHPWDGTLLRHDGVAKTLALPFAQIGLGSPEWEADGVKRWRRDGEATIDICLAGAATPTAYEPALELAEDLAQDFANAHDAGTFLGYRIRLSGPPLWLPPNSPTPFAGCWVFQLTISWETSK